jgi:hypothetical protein
VTLTPTGTRTPTHAPTITLTYTPTATRTPTSTRTPTRTVTSPPTPSFTRTATATRTPSRTGTPATPIPGDCTGDGQLTSQDLDRLLQIFDRCPTCSGGVVAGGCAAVGGADKQCFSADADGNGCITAGELTRVLHAAAP